MMRRYLRFRNNRVNRSILRATEPTPGSPRTTFYFTCLYMVPPNDDQRSRHHKAYYITGGDLYLQTLDGTVFRVNSHFFTHDSQLFNSKFNHSATPGAPREGTAQNNPIKLDVSVGDFEKFLWVFYNPTYSLYEAEAKDWSRILELAHMWNFIEVKAFALRELEKKENMDLIQRIVLYQQNKVEEKCLLRHYAFLCARDTALTLEECRLLGLETTYLISAAREKLRAAPSDEGRSPLPQGTEPGDIDRALTALLHPT